MQLNVGRTLLLLLLLLLHLRSPHITFHVGLHRTRNKLLPWAFPWPPGWLAGLSDDGWNGTPVICSILYGRVVTRRQRRWEECEARSCTRICSIRSLSVGWPLEAFVHSGGKFVPLWVGGCEKNTRHQPLIHRHNWILGAMNGCGRGRANTPLLISRSWWIYLFLTSAPRSSL